MLIAIQEAKEFASRSSVQRKRGDLGRLGIFEILIEALGLSHGVLTRSGSLSRIYFDTMASNLILATKPAFGIFQADTCAHCGAGMMTELECFKLF